MDILVLFIDEEVMQVKSNVDRVDSQMLLMQTLG
nr:MAG TPA: hypothetical protein [Caudoviricetes sp.]DAN97663.1 MAG TPA: hypothetical protein [Caudoviricetes sp.]